jgi:hypothetical protein
MIVSHRHVCCFTVYRFHVKWRKTKIPDECLKNSMFYYNNGTCGFHQFIIINLDSHVHFSICTLIYIYLFIISHIYIIGGVYHHVSRLVFWRSHPYYIHIYMYIYIYHFICSSCCINGGSPLPINFPSTEVTAFGDESAACWESALHWGCSSKGWLKQTFNWDRDLFTANYINIG